MPQGDPTTKRNCEQQEQDGSNISEKLQRQNHASTTVEAMTVACGGGAASGGGVSPRTILNSVLAGYTAGVFGTLVGHPMDSAKVWLQTKTRTSPQETKNLTNDSSTKAIKKKHGQPTHSNDGKARTRATSGHAVTNTMPLESSSSRPKTRVLLRAAQTNIRNLYAGVTGPLLTVGLLQSVNFAVFDSVRRVLYGLRFPHENQQNALNYRSVDPIFHVTISATVSGSVLAVCSSPVLLIKTKQQVATKKARHLSMRQAFMETVMMPPLHNHRNDNHYHQWQYGRQLPQLVRKLYVGFGPHLLAVAVGRAVYMTTYEGLKRTVLHYKQQQQHQQQQDDYVPIRVTLQERMVCAAIAGMMDWGLIFPLDVLRCRLYAQTGQQQQQYIRGDGGHTTRRTNTPNVAVVSKNARKMAVHMMFHEAGGIRNFYRGFTYAIVRAGPVAAAILPIYDMTLENLTQLSSSASQYQYSLMQ